MNQLEFFYGRSRRDLPSAARAVPGFARSQIKYIQDGNGRVGLILLNYLAVSLGYPPIVIKGIQPEERERYY